ncbi:hypothetical protein E4U57_003948 [Claviceps arundinis]|uniref:Zn(2)-C6 fungal-type domain-containing protein n=1 Tax=Claviceps arundinis TaxID=1623583 RepID=A0A9P7MLZ9_9HYPO|nr:hypothetical protein E4U57_003948 [Claviceps arundinis]KAG5960610.1 hypothetical protein E4U56_004244 [Claviceps arundinis]
MASLFNKTESIPPPRQIRFVNNQGHPPSKRRRINAACLTCRRRKTRCAGERPFCSTCTKNGHHCQGYPEVTRTDVAAETRNAKGAADEEDTPPGIAGNHDDAAQTEGKFSDVMSTPTTSVSQHSSNGVQRRRELASPFGHPPTGRYFPPSINGVKRQREQSPQFINSGPGPYPLPSVEQSGPDAEMSHLLPSPMQHPSHPSAGTDDTPSSPFFRKNYSHRVPYFRYFGPTAIVPGFKQMVVSVSDRRRSTAGSQSAASPMSSLSGGYHGSNNTTGSDGAIEDLPFYDPSNAMPVHPLVLNLVKLFFVHLGCNYPFLKQQKFVRMVMDKRVETILVDAICAIGARFSDAPQLAGGGHNKVPRTERGHGFAQRAKQATVETFPCPSVGAVQAMLLMAYEGFGANQDSALWMYLGLAIRMAIDLGLQKRIGIQYQGEKDPWYTRHMSRPNGIVESPEQKKTADTDALSLEEQKEVEQERIDTFWALFFLDRVISSGTGRTVTLREENIELPFLETQVDSMTGWPVLYPVLLQIVHLYGRVSDLLNNVRDAKDLTEDRWIVLAKMEHQLTKMHKAWDRRLQFNVSNFKAYLGLEQGTTFILLHTWFHALFIVLHQPTLLTPFGQLKTEHQLLSDSRELSMSSAKTICDILSFADLIDPISVIGNPFTSQPIYIAACAFLMETSANASLGSSREASPPSAPEAMRPPPSTMKHPDPKTPNAKHSRHSVLASAANQNYQRCYNSLDQMNAYWGGVKYILNALDQKAKGIWDCETYTSEEYESTKMPPDQADVSDFVPFPPQSPKIGAVPPIAWSLSGTANSPSSNLTLLYPNQKERQALSQQLAHHQHLQAVAQRQANTPPGNMLYDPIRQSMPVEQGSMYPPPSPSMTNATSSPNWLLERRPPSALSNSVTQRMAAQNMASQPYGPAVNGLSEASDAARAYIASAYTQAGNNTGSYEAFSTNVVPTNNVADAASSNSVGGNGTPGLSSFYPPGVPTYPPQWEFGNGIVHDITFNSREIDIGGLGFQQPDVMTAWLDWYPNEVLNLLANHEANGGQNQLPSDGDQNLLQNDGAQNVLQTVGGQNHLQTDPQP